MSAQQKNNKMHTSAIQDDVLLAKINAAVKVVDAAEANVATARATVVLHSKAVGLLLIDLKRLHPSVKAFTAALARLDKPMSLAWAYDRIKLVGGRKSDDEIREAEAEHKADAAARKKKSRAKPEKVSVTDDGVTETFSEATPAAKSRRALSEFEYACRAYLPHLNDADLTLARAYITCDEWRPKVREAA